MLAEKWESQRPTELIVTPLIEHDTILGMPFLVDEGILVNLAQSKVILPTVHAEEDGLGDGDLNDGLDDDLEQGLEGEVAEELAIKVDSKVEIATTEWVRHIRAAELVWSWWKLSFYRFAPRSRQSTNLCLPNLTWPGSRTSKSSTNWSQQNSRSASLMLIVSCHQILPDEMNILQNSTSISSSDILTSLQRASQTGHLTLILPTIPLSLKMRIFR